MAEAAAQAPITGTVTAAGKAIPYASVTLYDGSAQLSDNVRADADGAFSLHPAEATTKAALDGKLGSMRDGDILADGSLVSGDYTLQVSTGNKSYPGGTASIQVSGGQAQTNIVLSGDSASASTASTQPSDGSNTPSGSGDSANGGAAVPAPSPAADSDGSSTPATGNTPAAPSTSTVVPPSTPGDLTTVLMQPTPTNFSLAKTSVTYNKKRQAVKLKADSGMGAVTVSYQEAGSAKLSKKAPLKADRYTVYVTTAASQEYAATTTPLAVGTFTIKVHAPSALRLKKGAGKLTVHWKDYATNGANVSYYRVYYKTLGGAWAYQTYQGNRTNKATLKLAAKTKYKVKVVAYRSVVGADLHAATGVKAAKTK
jgi:hypothetical protein